MKIRQEQLLFDFYSEAIEAEEKRKRELKKNYEFKPQKNGKLSDNQLIKNAEKKYFENRKDDKALYELQQLIKATAKRMIIHERQKRGFYIDYRDEGEEKAMVVADYIIAQYLSRPFFELEYPSAYIYLRVLASLYGVKPIDKNTLYIDYDV